MNNFKAILERLSPPHLKTPFSKAEAADYFGIKIDDVMYSDGIVKGKGVWYNDETEETVPAKETPDQILGKYKRKRL